MKVDYFVFWRKHMKIAIIDDEPKELRLLASLMKQQLSAFGYTENVIDYFYSGEEFLAAFRPGRYELILLDIYMGRMSGIDTARKIRKQDPEVFLVFSTSSNEFASESYEINARYYLRKPFSEKDISDMLKRLDLKNYEFSRSVTLPDGQILLLRNIICTEYYNHIVTIYNKKGDNIRTRISQTEFERLLQPYLYFCRCSKGVLANLYEVTEQEGNCLAMSNGKIIYVSRRKTKDVQNAYTNFLFDRMRKELKE